MKSLRKARGCLLLVRGTNDCPTYQHFGCMVRTIHAGLLICTHICSSATRIAHQLLDGPIPMDKIRVHLTDLVVHSLREMPKHKNGDWDPILRTIGDDFSANTSAGWQGRQQCGSCQTESSRSKACLCCRLSLSGGRGLFVEGRWRGIRSTVFQRADQVQTKVAGNPGLAHEKLSAALLSALPNLVLKFKGDHAILRNLALLPRYSCKHTLLLFASCNRLILLQYRLS